MGAAENSAARSHLAIHQRGIALAADNIQLITIACQHLYPLLSHLGRINKDASPVVVRPEVLGKHTRSPKRVPLHADSHGPGTLLTRILKALERPTPTRAREEGQLPAPNDLHTLVRVADLELAPRRTVVAAGAEAEVCAAAPHEGVDGPVAGAVENPAVIKVGAAGDDEKGCGGSPWLAQQGGLGEWDDGVVGREQATQGVDALADRGNSCAGA